MHLLTVLKYKSLFHHKHGSNVTKANEILKKEKKTFFIFYRFLRLKTLDYRCKINASLKYLHTKIEK